MAMNVKQLNEAVTIDLSRCEALADKMMEKRRLDAELLSAASVHVQGDRRWFALRTIAVNELDLCKRLIDSQIDAVVPRKEVQGFRRGGHRAKRVVHKPVLRGMVFVNLVPSNRAYAGLLRVKGVYSLLGKDNEPHPIGGREMNVFMDLAEKGVFDERNTPTGLAVGSRVKIKVGAYDDFMGVLEGYAKGRTARVLTCLFGHDRTVDVKLAHLEKLE